MCAILLQWFRKNIYINLGGKVVGRWNGNDNINLGEGYMGVLYAIQNNKTKFYPSPLSSYAACIIITVSICNYLYYSIGEGNGTPFQYSCLENPMDRGAWKAAVHRVTEGRTRLSDFTFTFHFHASEKEMTTHSSVLAWRIPGKGEPGGPPSVGSYRVGHN